MFVPANWLRSGMKEYGPWIVRKVNVSYLIYQIKNASLKRADQGAGPPDMGVGSIVPTVPPTLWRAGGEHLVQLRWGVVPPGK